MRPITTGSEIGPRRSMLVSEDRIQRAAHALSVRAADAEVRGEAQRRLVPRQEEHLGSLQRTRQGPGIVARLLNPRIRDVRLHLLGRSGAALESSRAAA